jgi:hypothetical protein
MKSTPFIAIAWGSSATILSCRYFWTGLFGYGQNPILLDAVASMLVLSLGAWSYVKSGKNKAVLAAFLPLLLLTIGPLVFTVATVAAWTTKGFAP